MGLYYATSPWMREFVNVTRRGLPAIKLWAYDHLCLVGWPVPPAHKRRPLVHLLKFANPTNDWKADALGVGAFGGVLECAVLSDNTAAGV